MLRATLTGWKPSCFEIYCHAWNKYGGSLYNHPKILALLESRQPGQLNYYHKRVRGEVVGACYVNRRGQPLHPDRSLPIIAENLMLPIAPELRGYLPLRCKRLSYHHQGQFINAHHGPLNRRAICIVKSQFSRTTRKRRTLESNKFQASGGEIVPVSRFSADELSAIYTRLFTLRWGGKHPCVQQATLAEFLHAIGDMVFGNVLLFNGEPCAYDLLYQAESPDWIYFDDHNGGVNPALSDFSVGSILLWHNILSARERCAERNKRCIFSLGMANKKWGYKKLWADENPLGKTLF